MLGTSLRRRAIERLAADLLNKTNIQKPPVEIERIAKFLNIEIRKHPYKGHGLSGILIRDGNRVIVGVNSKHHEHRQRFSMTHEIGHFLLHEGTQAFVDREYKVNFRDNNSSLGTNLQEIEANAFASLLLIPEEFLLKDLAKYEIDILIPKGMEKIEKLARTLANKYNVSPASMMLRLSSLS